MARKLYLGSFHQKNVSILLLLEMPQWQLRRRVKVRCAFRFNPSFTGNAAMAFRDGKNLIRIGQGFNPSFTGNAAMARLIPPWQGGAGCVSILLLLEMPQWPERW